MYHIQPVPYRLGRMSAAEEGAAAEIILLLLLLLYHPCFALFSFIIFVRWCPGGFEAQ